MLGLKEVEVLTAGIIKQLLWTMKVKTYSVSTVYWRNWGQFVAKIVHLYALVHNAGRPSPEAASVCNFCVFSLLKRLLILWRSIPGSPHRAGEARATLEPVYNFPQVIQRAAGRGQYLFLNSLNSFAAVFQLLKNNVPNNPHEEENYSLLLNCKRRAWSELRPDEVCTIMLQPTVCWTCHSSLWVAFGRWSFWTIWFSIIPVKKKQEALVLLLELLLRMCPAFLHGSG